jgi:proteasome lid subunit RPN8/RPN11
MKAAIHVQRVVVDSILTYATVVHPREGILLLRGRSEKHTLIIEEVVIPPFAVHGRGFSRFSGHRLPADFSIVGTAHSHPSGILRPSTGDLNNFYGKVMVITIPPYQSEDHLAIFTRDSTPVPFIIQENERNASSSSAQRSSPTDG